MNADVGNTASESTDSGLRRNDDPAHPAKVVEWTSCARQPAIMRKGRSPARWLHAVLDETR